VTNDAAHTGNAGGSERDRESRLAAPRPRQPAGTPDLSYTVGSQKWRAAAEGLCRCGSRATGAVPGRRSKSVVQPAGRPNPQTGSQRWVVQEL